MRSMADDAPLIEETPEGLRYTVKVPKELFDDFVFTERQFLIRMGIVKPTPEEAREIEEAKQQQAELLAAGLLNDQGEQILPTECPSTLEDGEGNWHRCDRPRGHSGQHMVTLLWGDE